MTCAHCSAEAVWEVARADVPAHKRDWRGACDSHVGRVIDSFPRKAGALAYGVVVES